MNHYLAKPDSPEELLQSGVKGMKWGVRKDRGHEGESAKTKKIAKLDKKFEKNSQSFSTRIALHNRAAQLTNSHDVDRINNKSQYKHADFTHDSPLRQKYYNEHEQAFLKNLTKAANEAGTNASGTRKYKIDRTPDGDWGVSVVHVKHAETDEEESFVVKVKYDNAGHIVGVEMPEDAVKHFGVKGMHWGTHKKSQGDHADYSKSSQAYDRSNFRSKGAVSRINSRMHAGKTIKEARDAEYKYRKNRRRAVAIGVAAFKNRKRIIAGAKVAAHVVGLVAGVAAVSIATKAETNRGRASAAESMGISSKPHVPSAAKQKRGVYNITNI